MEVLWALSVIAAGALAGATVNNAIAMVPALRTLDETTYLEVRRAWSAVPEACIAAAGSGGALAGLALLLFADPLKSSPQALLAAGLALGLVTAAAEVPVMRLQAAGRLDPRAERQPSDVGTPRRWDAAQLIAAGCSLGMLICYAIAAVHAP